MSRLTLLLSLIAVLSQVAFGLDTSSNMLLVANENYGNGSGEYGQYLPINKIRYPSYDNVGLYLPGGQYPTLPFWFVGFPFHTAGLASESPLCNEGHFYTSFTTDTGSYIYIAETSEQTGVIGREVHFGVIGSPPTNLIHASGLATRYLADGSIPASHDPFFYSGGSFNGSGVVVVLDYDGSSCPGESMYGYINPINSSTEKVVGLTFNPSYTTLYALTRMDSGQYQVFQASNLTDTLTFTTWSGLFSIPSGATTVYDCGMVGDQIVFGVSHACTYPLWSIEQGGTSASAVTEVIWKEISTGIISGYGWLEPRGLDFVYFPPWAPISTSRETQNSGTSIAPEISVSENPFRYSTIVSAETTGMLSIYDLSGRLVSESEFHGSYAFDPRASGVYFVQITDGETVTSARLVKL